MSQWRRPARLLASLFLLVFGLGRGVVAQSTGNKAVGASAAAAGHSADDPDFARLVKEWTTRPDFTSPLVDHLPKVAGVPSPKDILGHHIGEPKKLTYYADMLKYYRALAAASPRVKVITIGKTNEGRDLVVVFVGADESIKNLETYRGYLAQLADPRKITDAQAKEIIAKAKPLYHLSGGLHSGEVGPSEMLMELAYRVATEDSALVKQIRDNVIVSITPVADPTAAIATWTNAPQVRYQRNRRQSIRPAPACRILGQASSTTTIATSITRRSRCARCSTGTCSGTPMRTTCIRRRRCSTFSGRAPQNRTSTRSLRRAADDGELRDSADGQMRHARRLDARLRGHVVARLSRLHVVEPQRRSVCGSRARAARTRRSCASETRMHPRPADAVDAAL